jgi:DNA polymerase-4
MPVGVMSGVGPRSAERLASLGVCTLGQLARLDVETAQAVMGSFGPELLLRARGIDERPVHENDPAKQVSKEHTFDTDVRSAEDLDAAIETLAAAVGQRMRRKGVSGRTVTVKVRFSDFSTRTVRRTLSSPTDDEGVFGPIARGLVRTVWSPGVGVRLLGVGLSGFEQRSEQLSLGDTYVGSDDGDPSTRVELVRGIDAVRHRFGDEALVRGRDIAAPSSRADDDESEVELEGRKS